MGLSGGGVGGCCFCDDVPVVVKIESTCSGSRSEMLALDAVGTCIIEVFHYFIVGEGDLGEAVFAVPSVGFASAVA